MITKPRSALLKEKPVLENRFRLPGTSTTMYLPENVRPGRQVAWHTTYSMTEWFWMGRHFMLTILEGMSVELVIREKNAKGRFLRAFKHKPITEQQWLSLCELLPPRS